jgi:hypothetical protein
VKTRSATSGVAASLLGLGMLVACAPEGQIAESSKTKECSAELVSALGTFSRDLGLAYAVTPADADSIFRSGQVEKHYARDGVQYGSHFGLEKTAKGCTLKFYKRTTSEPGTSTSTTGSFGTVALQTCKCK